MFMVIRIVAFFELSLHFLPDSILSVQPGSTTYLKEYLLYVDTGYRMARQCYGNL